jgi:hypothetical protein
MRENRTYGSVRGAPGNRRSYRDIDDLRFTISDLVICDRLIWDWDGRAKRPTSQNAFLPQPTTQHS